MRDHKTKNDQMIVWFLEMEPHTQYLHTYKLWDKIKPTLGWNDIYDMNCLELTEWAHINEFKFESDWNWLMHLVKQIRTRIIIPMDCDLNNWRHEQYQRLKGYLEAKVQEVDQAKIYAACMEMLDWWYLMTKWKERQKEKEKA